MGLDLGELQLSAREAEERIAVVDRVFLQHGADPHVYGADKARVQSWLDRVSWVRRRTAKGDWDKARCIVENEKCANAAWVAGHIHRARGDIRAARSWYIRAERPAPNTPPELERAVITRVLLARMHDLQAA